MDKYPDYQYPCFMDHNVNMEKHILIIKIFCVYNKPWGKVPINVLYLGTQYFRYLKVGLH